MIFQTVSVGLMQVNCYILACAPGAKAMIIDPGDQASKIKAVLSKYELKPAMVINTHGHYDHIACDDAFGVPVYAHKDDLPMLLDPAKNLSAAFSLAYKVKSEVRPLTDKEIIKLDCLELEVIHLPGHTPGGIGLLMKKPEHNIVFTGDTLFCQGVGRTDLPGGSQDKLEDGIRQRLFVLNPDTQVYPGHGAATTIGQERSREFDL